MKNEEIRVGDFKWGVGQTYIITYFKRNNVYTSGIVWEWKCLEISPKGCVKVHNNITKDVMWLFPHT